MALYPALFISGYDKRVRPNYGGRPVKVTAQVYTERMDVRDRDLDMSLTIYLRWNIKVNWLTNYIFNRKISVIAIMRNAEEMEYRIMIFHAF